MPDLVVSFALFQRWLRDEGASAEAYHAASLVGDAALRQLRRRGASTATDLTLEDLADAFGAEWQRLGQSPMPPDRFLLLGELLRWHMAHAQPSRGDA